MKKLLRIVLTLCIICSVALCGSDATVRSASPSKEETTEQVYSGATVEDDFAEDRVIVVLNNTASTSLHTYSAADFSGINCVSVNSLNQAATELVSAKLTDNVDYAIQLSEMNSVTVQDYYNVDVENFRQVLCLTLDDSGKQHVLDAIELLSKHPDVAYAGPDYKVFVNAVYPNDTYNDEQWAVEQINLPNAWSITTGNASVRVGVVDTGIDGDHPELSSKINVSLSRDFTLGSVLSVDEVTDPDGHGTHVAGIIGAATNNNLGISGTCFSVELISLRVLDENGEGFMSSVYNAVDYAFTMGIPILNMSIGWKSDWLSYDTDASYIMDTFPGLIVCAAGNDNYNLSSTPVYPAAYSADNILCVGASTQSDARCSFSNYSSTMVDIFAPGESILSCYTLSKCQDGTHDIQYTSHHANGYHVMDGTSMATPYVTGVAALILARYPTLSATQIKTRIMEGAEIASTLSGLCKTGGRLNAYRALHNHTYTYAKCNAATHYRQCACGLLVYDSHVWTTNAAGQYICSVCGYISLFSPYNIEVEMER